MNKKLSLALAMIAIVLGVIVVRSLLSTSQMQAKNSVLEKDKDELRGQLAASSKRLAQISDDNAGKDAEIERWRKQATLATANAHTPAALGPLKVETCKDESGHKHQAVVAEGSAREQVQTIVNAEADAEKCKADFAACAARLAEMDHQLAIQQQIEGKTEEQLANATEAATGKKTGLGARLKLASKCGLRGGIGGGVGALAGYLWKGKQGALLGGAAGGFAGGVSCTF